MNDFLAFWHTFGPYTGPDGEVETPERIISRKREEICRNNGWTLWSFSHKTNAMRSWIREIKRAHPERVLVLCSESPSARNPAQEQICLLNAQSYREYDTEEWYPVPQEIEVPQKWTKKGLASAFKVSKIFLPEEDYQIDRVFKRLPTNPITWQPTCEWQRLFVGDNVWLCEIRLARGEFMLQKGRGFMLRPIRALLELEEPYVVEISNENKQKARQSIMR